MYCDSGPTFIHLRMNVWGAWSIPQYSISCNTLHFNPKAKLYQRSIYYRDLWVVFSFMWSSFLFFYKKFQLNLFHIFSMYFYI